MKKITPEIRAKIIGMALAGSYRQHIADSVGVSLFPIYTILKAEGIKAARKPGAGRPKKILLTYAEVAQQFKDGSMQTEIAARAGVSREHIRQILNKEIPDLDGDMNMRRYPQTRACEICGAPFVVETYSRAWQRVCGGECRTKRRRDAANTRAIVTGSRAKQVGAYNLRVEGMKWGEIGKALELNPKYWGGAAMAVSSARRHAEREGLPWPIPGVDGKQYRRPRKGRTE